MEGYGCSLKEIEYWATHRTRIADLYNSEKYFFNELLPKVETVLDFGCAAGGSFLFSRELNANVKYSGIDINVDLVNFAKERFPEASSQFYLADGPSLPFDNNSFDLIFSFGVFHHLSDWKNQARELIRASKRYVLFDIRCWDNESLKDEKKSYQKIALGGEWDGKTVVPYNIISYNELFNFLIELKKQNIGAKLIGYHASPTSLAVTPAEKVLMLSILFEKNTSNIKFEIT